MENAVKEPKSQFKLPDNAARELKPGEKYEPLLNPNKTYPEVSFWSVSI